MRLRRGSINLGLLIAVAQIFRRSSAGRSEKRWKLVGTLAMTRLALFRRCRAALQGVYGQFLSSIVITARMFDHFRLWSRFRSLGRLKYMTLVIVASY